MVTLIDAPSKLTPLEEMARAHAREERAEQGLEPTVSDPILIERLAVMLRPTARASDGPEVNR